MKRRHKVDKRLGDRHLAPFCLCGAQTALHYLHALTHALEGARQAQDSEHVHRLRVASRRLRSLLPLLTPCLARQTRDRWRKHLRRLTRALGAARDTDVQISWVQRFAARQASAEERPGVERLQLRLQQQRQAQQESVVAALERFASSQSSDAMARTLTQVVEASAWAEGQLPGRAVYCQMRQAIGARLHDLLAYGPCVGLPECGARLHAMRIAVKRLRYTMQAFAPLYPEALEAPIDAARTLQTVLGDIHDCDVWAQTLPRFLAAERHRTLVYFGAVAPLAPLVAGIQALLHDRQQYRMQRYHEFVAYWHQLQAEGRWEGLQHTLHAATRPPEHWSAEDTAGASVHASVEPEKETAVDQC